MPTVLIGVYNDDKRLGSAIVSTGMYGLTVSHLTGYIETAQAYKTANVSTSNDGCINSVETRHCLVSRSKSVAFVRDIKTTKHNALRRHGSAVVSTGVYGLTVSV